MIHGSAPAPALSTIAKMQRCLEESFGALTHINRPLFSLRIVEWIDLKDLQQGQLGLQPQYFLSAWNFFA